MTAQFRESIKIDAKKYEQKDPPDYFSYVD